MRRVDVVATLVAAGLAATFFVAGYPTLIYDSWVYYYLAGILRASGLHGWPTDLKTYGYPFFELLVTGWRDLPGEEFRLTVFVAQFAVWLGASAWTARRLAAVLESPRAGVAAYTLSVLNPVLLIQTTEPLSDLISAALVLTAVAACWRAPGDSERTTARNIFLCFLAAASAVMIRPANIAVVGGIAIVWFMRFLRWRDVSLRQVVIGLAGFIPPFLPQVAINHYVFGTWNPLIESNLYSLQATWGMRALKYGTLVMDERSPFLVYGNPLFHGETSPGAFIRTSPARYLATLFLHGFAMLDRDLPFTYVTDLNPWYGWPVRAVNLFLICLAAVGVAIALRRGAIRRPGEPAFLVLSTLLVATVYAALYLPVLVESRFGTAVQALAAPLIVSGMAVLPSDGPPRRRAAGLALAFALAALAGALTLSAWISRLRTNPLEGPAPVEEVSTAPR